MSNTTTRIADLPENISMQMATSAFPISSGVFGGGGGSGGGNGGGNGEIQTIGENSYMPLNIHPNPYNNQDQQQQLQQQPSYPLKSRDIPINTMGLTNDEEIQPNYVPKKTTADYIRNYEENEEQNFKNREKIKSRDRKIDDFVSKFQVPIFVSLIFLIFQMPIVSTLMYKYLHFLPIYKEDGNMNFYGLLVKSVLFGTVYYFSDNIIQYLSYL
jgi:hypothetical protein